MTNEESRRATGRANEAARRASDGAAERRQIGQGMIERRTGKSQVEQINSVVAPPRTRKTLSTLPPRGGQAGQVGTGNYSAPQTSGGGIASPLTEVPDTRTYYDPVLLPSTDGLAWIKWRAVKQISMTDANNATVVMDYANDIPE